MKFSQFTGKIDNEANDSAVRQLIIAEMVKAAPLLGYLEFYAMLGSADKPQKNATSGEAGQSRAINDDYEGTNTTPSFGDISLQIFGDKVLTDLEWVARGGTIDNEHVRQIRARAKALGKKLQYKIQNDNYDASLRPLELTGIKSLVDSSQLVTYDAAAADAGGAGYMDITNKIKFLEEFDQFLSKIEDGADIVFMDSKTRNRLNSFAKDILTVTQVQDYFGKNQQVWSYNGIPIVESGQSGSNLTIPHNEVVTFSESVTRGASTSIYAMKFGERSDLTVATNVGLRVDGPKHIDNFVQTRLDLSLGIGLLNTKSLARMQGIVVA